MGCRVLLQGIFPVQGSNPCLMSPALAGRFITISTTWKALLLAYIFTKKFALDPHTPPTSASFLCSYLKEKKKNLLQTYLYSLSPIYLFLLPLALIPVKYLIPPSTEIAFSRLSTTMTTPGVQKLGKIFFSGLLSI